MSSPSSFTATDIFFACFEGPLEGPGHTGKDFICTMCNKVYQDNSGHSNCATQAKNQHVAEWEAKVRHYLSQKGGANHRMQEFFPATDRGRNKIGWLELILCSDLAFSFVDNPYHLKTTKLLPIGYATFMRTMVKMYSGMVARIRNILPPYFGGIFDDWSGNRSSHLMAFIASFYSHEKGCSETVLLGVNRLADPTNQTSENHATSVNRLLAKYHRGNGSLLFLVGDTCSTNRKTARLLGAPLVPCANHLIALAEKQFARPHRQLLNDVHDVLTTIHRGGNSLAKLARRTDVRVQVGPTTRWDRDYTELKNMKELAPTLNAYAYEIGGVALAQKVQVLTAQRLAEADALLVSLTDFRSVSIKMQTASSTLATWRVQADALLAKHNCPAMEPYLTAYGAKQTAPRFTTGVAKIQAGLGSTLTAAESEAVAPLRLIMHPNHEGNAEPDEEVDEVEEA